MMRKKLCSFSTLPKSFKCFKDAILYGKDQTISLDDVHKSVQIKELQKLQDLKIEDNGEGLNVSRGRSEKK